MKYLSKSNLKYVLVRDNSKGAKPVYDIYDAKDTKSGVHYAEGGLTDSVYKLKSQTIVIDDKGKVVDEKMNGIWLKKNAKPIGSIEKSEIDNMKSLQDWKDHIEGKSKSGDSGLSLNPTRVYKNAYGWVARTSTVEPINGYDYEITTMRRYNKVLLSDAQGGKDEAGGVGVKIFVYTPSQDPSIELVRTMPKMVNEKKVREQHEEALEKFKYLYKEGRLPKAKGYAHGGMTDSKKDISRIVLSDDNEKVFVDTPSMAQANEVLYGIWNSNKYSDVTYDITFEDGKEISGSIDLEPHSFHKGHEKKILTWHLLTYYNNVARSEAPYISQESKDYAKNIVANYKLYGKGGGVENIEDVEISNFRKNIMGTLSFDMKMSNMRKTQDFIVYPVSEKTDYIMIQSNTRFGKIEMSTGRGLMTQSHPNGAYAFHLHIDKLVKFQLSDSQLENLKQELAKTAGRNVGRVGVVSDNEFADKFAKGGEVSKKTTYISNRNIESIHAKIKDKKVSLKGSDILDGVYAKNEALNKPFDLIDAYNEIANLSYDAWDKLGIESGGAIYNSDAIQKKLANEYEKSGVDAAYMKYNAAQRRKIREMLTDENQHSLRNYFALRGYSGDKEYSDYKNLYEQYIKEKRKIFLNPANIEYQPKKKFEVGGELFGAGHYAKGGSVDAYVPVSKKITTQEINDFVDYVEGFYGKKGLYADELDGGFTKKQIKDAVNKYLNDLDRNPTWGDGDSIDRERVRQYLQKMS